MNVQRQPLERRTVAQMHGDVRAQAALYLQRLDDARTFIRYAERAFMEAKELAPDDTACDEAEELRVQAVQLRKQTQTHRYHGSGRFNPKRTVRRVVIDKGNKK